MNKDEFKFEIIELPYISRIFHVTLNSKDKIIDYLDGVKKRKEEYIEERLSYFYLEDGGFVMLRYFDKDLVILTHCKKDTINELERIIKND